MKAFSGNNLKKTENLMIDINNKNNFTLFIFHWTYKYRNIYFYGICENFGKSKGQNLLQEAPHNVVLTFESGDKNLHWKLELKPVWEHLQKMLDAFFLFFFIFFFKWHLKLYSQTSKTMQMRNISGMLLSCKKKANQEWETKPQARTLISLWFYD